MLVSKSKELNINDFKAWCRNVIVMFSPVLIALLTSLQNWEIVDWRILFSMAIWIIIDVVRRYLKNYTK
jgi:hypothetical protein